jgi:serine/threonine protein kinase/tetratricopeptide (TPR) repeat protein
VKIGPYEVLDELGRGGMGVVYRVRGADGRDAALKLLLGGVEDPDEVAAFEREVRLLRSFSLAEGFVPVIDTGSEQGRPFLVMPFLEGGTLRQRLRARKLGVEESVALVASVAEAMGFAHEKGVVHRDLKPENVLFDKAGRAFVADLGFAKHFRRDVFGASKSGSLSQTGVIAGTAGFMAPEQLEDSKRAGPRADVFALGAILHEALTGERAFEGAGLLGYVEALRAGPVAPSKLRPGVPAWLDEVVERALARDERERFADARELARALRGGGPRSRRLIGLLLLGAAFLALGVLVLWRQLSGEPIEPKLAGRSPSPVEKKLGSPPPKPAEDKPRDPPPAPASEAAKLLADAEEERHLKNYGEVMRLTTQALELDPGLARAWSGRAEARLERGDRDGAIADATRAIELDARDRSAWWIRGAARVNTGDLALGVEDETKAIEVDPTNALALALRAEARRQLGDPEGALADATSAIELDPSNAQAWLIRATLHEDAGRIDEAIVDLNAVIERNTGVPRAWEHRGEIRAKKNDLQGAIADLTKAIELAPREDKPWLNRADARKRSGDLEGSLADLTKAIEVAPDQPNGWYARGKIRHALHQLEPAMADLNRACELTSNAARAVLERGLVFLDEGDFGRAEQDFTRANELEPGAAPPLENRGIARLRLGNREGGIADLEKALKLARDEAEAARVTESLEKARSSR